MKLLDKLHSYIPSPETLKQSKSLGFLGDVLDDPNLFHMNRRSVAMAIFWGVFIGLLPPIPLHTPAAAIAALLTRANLPLCIAVVWIGNPITAPVIMYISYYIGRLILHVEPISHLEFSWAWIKSQFAIIWKPYLVGSIFGAFISGLASYFATSYLWRLNVKRKWIMRKRRREQHQPE